MLLIDADAAASESLLTETDGSTVGRERNEDGRPGLEPGQCQSLQPLRPGLARFR